MTTADLGAIIARAFALFYMFKAAFMLVMNIIPTLSYVGVEGGAFMVVWHFVSLFLFLLFAVSLWFGAEKVGRLIAGKGAPKKISVFPPEHFMAAVFVGFGCLLLSSAVPEVSKLLAYVFGESPVRKGTVVEISTSIVLYLVLSLIFILGARGLQRAVFFLRGMGQKP